MVVVIGGLHICALSYFLSFQDLFSVKQSLDTFWEKDVAWVRPDECFVDRAERALPHAKALPTGCGATAQLRRLTLFRTSISRKRHESVMSRAMNSIMGSAPEAQLTFIHCFLLMNFERDCL